MLRAFRALALNVPLCLTCLDLFASYLRAFKFDKIAYSRHSYNVLNLKKVQCLTFKKTKLTKTYLKLMYIFYLYSSQVVSVFSEWIILMDMCPLLLL